MAWKPFPLAHLPECARQYVAEAAESVGCDAVQVALPLLSCLGAAIGNSRVVHLKKNWAEPALLWTVVATEAGMQQGRAAELATVFMRQRQERDLEIFRRVLEDRGNPEMMATASGRRRRLAERRQMLASRPMQVLTSPVSLERLAARLSVSPRGILWLRDDVGGWLRSFEDHRAGRGAEASQLLSIHRAGSVMVECRQGGQETIHVHRAYVAIAGGMETEWLARLLRPRSLARGVMARFLLAMPPRGPHGWTEKEVSVAGSARLQAVFERLWSLTGNAAGSHLEPVAVGLDEEAKSRWVRFLHHHAERLPREDSLLTGAWSELECYCARLALILKLVQSADGPGNGEVTCIDAVTMDHAAGLTHWFAEETARIYRHMPVDLDSGDGDREVLEWIAEEGGVTTVRKLMRRFRRRFPSGSAAEDALRQLSNAGFLTAELNLPGLGGGHTVVSYRLNPGRRLPAPGPEPATRIRAGQKGMQLELCPDTTS